MKTQSGLTLAGLLVITTATAALALALTFYAVLEWSRRSIVRRSETLRAETARQIGTRLSSELGVPAATLEEIALAIQYDVLRVEDRGAIEGHLFSELLAHPTVSDVTLTHATSQGRSRSDVERCWPRLRARTGTESTSRRRSD